MGKRGRMLAWQLLALGVGSSCGKVDHAASVCEPGATQECVGPVRCPGVQICEPGGEAWGTCNCGAVSTGGSGASSSGGVAGTISAGGDGIGATGGVSTSSSGGTGGSPGTHGSGGASGVSGTSSGGTSSGGMNTGGTSSGGMNTGGTSTGGIGPTPVCQAVTVVTGTNPIVADFEAWTSANSWHDPSGWVGGAYAYGDGSAVVTLGIDSPGAHGSLHALHMHAAPVTSYYSGAGLEMDCADLSRFTGFAFWAKGSPSPVSVNVSARSTVSATDPARSGGTCTSAAGCTMGYYIPSLATDWTQYVVKWSNLAVTGMTKPDVTAVNGFNFNIGGNGTLDLWIDDFQFTGP